MAKHEFRLLDSCYLRHVDYKYASGNIIGLLALEMAAQTDVKYPDRRTQIQHIRQTGIYRFINAILGYSSETYRDPTLKMIEAGFDKKRDVKFNTSVDIEAYCFGEYVRALCPSTSPATDT